MRTLLAGLAGARVQRLDQAWASLAASYLGLRDPSIDALRLGLVKNALGHRAEDESIPPPPPKPARPDFAQRVLEVARDLVKGNGRFGPNAPIAEV